MIVLLERIGTVFVLQCPIKVVGPQPVFGNILDLFGSLSRARTLRLRIPEASDKVSSNECAYGDLNCG